MRCRWQDGAGSPNVLLTNRTAYRLRLDAPDSHLDDDELQPSATPHLELYVWSDKDTGAPQCWQAPETSPAEHELAWLQSELLPRLAVVVQRADFTSPLQRWRPAAGAELVPLAAHARRYQHLKATYSAQLIEACDLSSCVRNTDTDFSKTFFIPQRWTEKSMDPQKYLYEEMSLAAYILELFDRAPAADEGAFKHKFVDLGCGNGLLTFFLHAEGYSGWGIDIRARRMWDVYSSRPVLIEEAITPNDATSFE